MLDKNSLPIENIKKHAERLFAKLSPQLLSADEGEALPSEREKTKAYIKNAVGYLLKKGVLVLLAYLFGMAGAAFDTYPFGIALLSAMSRDLLFVYAGLLLSVFSKTHDMAAFFFIYTACLGLRYAFSRWYGGGGTKISRKKLAGNSINTLKPAEDKPTRGLFGEPLALRLLTAIVCSLSISLARLISDGFLYYDLFALMLAVAAAPLLCFAFYTLAESKSVPKQLYEAAVAAGIFSVVFAIRPYYILGFSAGILTAFLLTLYTSKHYGALRGVLVGLFAGIACDISLAPMFALAGFASGMLYSLTLFGAVGAASVCALIYGVSQSGFGVFSTLLPELAVGAAVFLPLAYYDLLPKPKLFEMSGYYKSIQAEQAMINKAMLDDSSEALESISKSLDGLSRTISMLSDRLRKPDVLDLKEICEKSFDKYCTKCSLAPVCYGKEAVATFDIIGKFTRALDGKGRIEMSDIPEYVGEKCSNILKIMSEANLSYSAHLEGLIRDDKTAVFAIDYKAVAKLIAGASKKNDEEYVLDREASAKLLRAVRYMELDAENVYVYGKRRKKLVVTGIDLSQIKMGADEIRRAFENICGTRLSSPIFDVDSDRVNMSMTSEKCYEVDYASASQKMDNSESNGDSSVFFENRDGKFYFLLSDGMGSGREASLTSRLCTMFLSKLLGAGCEKSIVIEMLNGFIRSRGCECSAGIDLAELDLMGAEGCFIKSGAAPSYIIRGKNLYKLQSKTLPIGILKDTDAEVINFELKDNDIIVMFSDGVASSLEDGAWLTSMLCYDFDADLNKMAQKILDKASENNMKCDDMTVGIMRVSKRA